MSKGKSGARGNPPRTWPHYTGNLKSALRPSSDFTIEVPKRLSAICELYGVDQADPLWERRLLMVLLHRHVAGFQVKPPRGPTMDNLFIIEIIDGLKAHHENQTGRRPSTDAVVTEMMEVQAINPIIAGLTHSRIMRIYSGRTKEIERYQRKWRAVEQKFSKVREASVAMQKLPEESHPRILLAYQERRR
jgi:hypothetical protein